MTEALLNILTRATVISSAGILLTLLLRKPFRAHFGPGLAYVLWLLVPTALLALLFPAPSAGLKAVLIVPLSMSLLTHHAHTGHHPVNVSVTSALDWRIWLLCAWGTGVLLFCCRLIVQQRRFIASLGVLSAVEDGILRCADPSSGPMVMGLLRPRILVPSDFNTRHSPEEQILILAHERMHIRRGDLLTNAACALGRCLFWFNPLIHVAARLVRFDQELACDAAVLRNHPHSRKPYANAMLRTQLVAGALPLGCYWPAMHPLKERIMLLKQPPARGLRRLAGQMMVGTCVLLAGYTTWAVQPDEVSGDPSRVTYADSRVRIHSDSVEASSGSSGRYSGNVTLELLDPSVTPTRPSIEFSSDSADSSESSHRIHLKGHVILGYRQGGQSVIQTHSDDAWLVPVPRRAPDKIEPESAGFKGKMIFTGAVQIEMGGHRFITGSAQMVGAGVFKMDEVEMAYSP